MKLRELEEMQDDVRLIAKEAVQLIENLEMKPDERGLKLSRLMLSMGRLRRDLEGRRAAMTARERKVFTKVLENAAGSSREERLAQAKGSGDVMAVSTQIAELDATYTEVKMIIAAIKHAILLSRGQMGMKE